MRFMLAFALLSLLLTACDRHDASLHKQLVGTWARGDSGVLTIDLDGSFQSRWTTVLTNVTKEWLYAGTWNVRDGFLISTVTNSETRNSTNSEAVGSVDRFRIISIDSSHLVNGIGGVTNYLERR